MPALAVAGSGDSARSGGLALYGKLPARGDFITRRFPRDFVLPWDTWLQNLLLAAQDALDTAWLDHYLTAPIWRFVLPAGVCGEAAVAGVWMASVDRVGRYFPLTLGTTGAFGDPMGFLAAAEPWFAALEAEALVMLDPEFDLDGWQGEWQSLWQSGAATPSPGIAQAAASGSAAPLAPTRYASADRVELAALLAGQRGACCWWTAGSEGVAPSLLVTPGLPGAEASRALLDGQWAACGWIDRDPAAPAVAPGSLQAASSMLPDAVDPLGLLSAPDAASVAEAAEIFPLAPAAEAECLPWDRPAEPVAVPVPVPGPGPEEASLAEAEDFLPWDR